MRIVSPLDFREAARRRLPHFLFEYIDGGAGSEIALGRNLRELAQVTLRQRVLTGAAQFDTSIQLFGQRMALPVALAPIGLAGMAARRGEVQAACAAVAADIPFCLSTVSLCPLPEVAAAAPNHLWFQLYMIRDRVFMQDLMDQARAAGCKALLFTVDMPLPGTRYRDYRSGLAGAPGIAGSIRRLGQALRRPRWAWDVGLRGRPHHLGNVAPVLAGRTGLDDFFAWMRSNFDPTVTWADLDFIRSRWQGPLIIKGVLDVEDARACARLGADGLVVSNHGGRQLDAAQATCRALPRIADAVGSELAVLVDGGVRTGLDVVRMLALGARAVLLGRSWAFALAAGGEAGVTRMLQMLEAEMRVTMALTGCTTIDQITPALLAGID